MNSVYWWVISDDEPWYRKGPHGPYVSKSEAEGMKRFYQRQNRDCAYRIECAPIGQQPGEKQQS